MSDALVPEDAGIEEISALVETLSATERRLEHLTGGQVDAVLTQDGRTFVLQRSQALMRQHEAVRQAAILDALPACVALVDGRGVIVSVNEAWRRFPDDNAAALLTSGVGTNYLEVCDRVEGDDSVLALAVAGGMRDVLAGARSSYSAEYRCDGSDVPRWYLMLVSPLVGRSLSGAVVTHFDITELTKARHDAQRSSQLLEAVIAGTPDHVFVKDREGRYLLCNESAARLLGRSIDEMIGRSNADLDLVERGIVTAEALGARAEIDRRVMDTGEPVSSEDTFGSAAAPRTYHATKAPYRNEHGEIIGVIGISRDISERKEAERTLQESQALLSMASRLTLVGSWYFDVPPTTVVWSDALALMHDEAPGFSPTVEQALAYYVPEHRDGVTAAVGACLADGTAFDVEHQLFTARGRRIWVRAIGEAVRGADGAIRRVQGALQDVSERKRAEHQTRLLADRLTNILGSITDAFLTLDNDWRFTFVNGEALRMLGRSSDSLIGSNLWQELPQLADTDLERGLRQAMLAGTGSRFDAFYAPLKGWIGVNCYPSKTGLSIYFRDITQQRKDQDALRELNADLEARVAARTAELTQAREDADQGNRAKSAFLAAMSHEIRTPMNGVVGMIDVLEQSSLKPSQAKIVQTVRESTYALLSIVDDVLDFSKIEAGHFHIDHEPMSLERVVCQARDTLGHLAAIRGVRLDLTVDQRLPARVLGDPQRLRQVLLNLVGNAIKFSRADRDESRVGVSARLVHGDDRRCMVEFTIDDRGIGMDEATLARLFTPFMQADDSTTKRFGGTGLGLSISHRLCNLMSGTIRATSRLGEGSCFTVTMAFDLLAETSAEGQDPGRDAIPDDTPGGEPVTMPMPLSALGASEVGRLILVAEDNEINQDVIRQQLALMGFTADIAADGAQALDLWRRGSHSLLLTDLHMPVLDGYELATAIRSSESSGVRMPIVALTANASKSEIKRCKEVGIDGCLTKPLRLVDLHAILGQWLPATAQPRPLRTVKAIHPSAAGRLPDVSPAPAPAVDISVLERLVGSDPDVIRAMLASFRASATRCRDATRAGVAAGACKAVADAVHAFKSAARSIGALRLAAICDEMEVSAGAGRTAELVEQLGRFEREYTEVSRLLDATPA